MRNQHSRRRFLAGMAAIAGGVPSQLMAGDPMQRTLLLRSGWQTENIGDIAHTAGVLALLEKLLPHHRAILWSRALDRGVDAMLRRRFSQIEIVTGKLDAKAGPDNDALANAIEQADLLLHGSGPSLVARYDVEQWLAFTGKPYGAWGVTTQTPDERTRGILSQAAFIYTRETQSLDHLKDAGIDQPVRAFSPDGTFAIDVRDEERAVPFMESHGLEEGRFICVVPRLRVTPYYKFKPRVKWTDERIRSVTELNEEWAEKDHAKAREAMIRWVRETGGKVLACPEMTYELDIIQELLIDPLPDDVKPHVVRREEYWLPDEAGSVYRRARAVLSFECHSPIIAFAHGTPAIYLRQPQDTIKGQMWYDLGVPKWVLEIEQTTGAQLADRLMDIHNNHDSALAYLSDAMSLAKTRFTESASGIDRLLQTL